MIKSSFQGFFWKTKTQKVNINDIEISIECLQSLDGTIDDLFHYLDSKGHKDLLEELSPYFGCIWPSGIALTRYLLSCFGKNKTDHLQKHPKSFRFCEVGCGLAIPSLFLSKALPLSRFLLTDYHPEVPIFLEVNLRLNSLDTHQIIYQKIDWKSLSSLNIQKQDWVIGSDLLYEKENPKLLADTLLYLIKQDGRIVIADPGRPYLEPFVQEMKARGWQAEVHADNDIFILDFKRI